MVGDDGVEGRCQPSVRIHAVQVAGPDQRGDDGPVLGTGVVTGKERVLSVQHNRTDGPLDSIAVELDAAIVRKNSSPAKYLVMSLSASPSGAFAETRAR